MKREVILVICAVILASFLFVQVDNNSSKIHGYAIAEGAEDISDISEASERVVNLKDSNKIASKVVEDVQEEGYVRVYIELESEVKKGKSIASRDVKEEVKGPEGDGGRDTGKEFQAPAFLRREYPGRELQVRP